eukprot:CAMPEP_0198249098 /NCGR_PEP_ID=MMETSP1447-20131203/708_1 /TAXON_ID=420782 /ORGANISM="Chaetoceros dichaeta, Strain CCMP1751" /LENGTH=203 /DNA_ID=CAMNT_0043933643 /DNA_START=231 /DNA_END=843 /DNA_ORIENTATION=+
MPYLQMQNTGDNNDSKLPSAHNSTGADTPLFFADEECYDLCELVDEEELEDVVLSSSSPMLLDVELQRETSTVPIENSRIGVATNQVASASSSNNSNNKSAEQVMGNIELRWNIDEDKDDCDLEDVSTCSDACDVCVGKGLKTASSVKVLVGSILDNKLQVPWENDSSNEMVGYKALSVQSVTKIVIRFAKSAWEVVGSQDGE